MAEKERLEGEAQEPPKKGGKKKGGKVLLVVGAFFTSMAIINMMMFFFFQKNMEELEATQTELEQNRPNPLYEAAMDSLLADSLSMAIGELVDHVVEKNTQLAMMQDSTARMISRLDSLREQLDEMERRELELTSGDIARLSRVFGSMQPRKAAPVMMKMDDRSVAAILLQIEERTAAKILAAMPPERAAGISRLIRERALAIEQREKS